MFRHLYKFYQGLDISAGLTKDQISLKVLARNMYLCRFYQVLDISAGFTKY